MHNNVQRFYDPLMSRKKLLHHFEQNEKDPWCFVRVTRDFGLWDRPELMDPDKIIVDGKGKPMKLTEVGDHEQFVALIQKKDEERKRGFWLFLKDKDEELEKKARALALEIAD